jgi:hypothetical protein
VNLVRTRFHKQKVASVNHEAGRETRLLIDR